MNQIYNNNLAALNKINPTLAHKVDRLETTRDDFVVVPTKNGQDYSLKMIESGNERLVHSLYRPRLQAEKKINKLKLGYHNLIGVAGIGCGHYIRAIMQEFSQESQVVVIENRPDILKEVMKHQDLTDILQQIRNIRIFDGSDKRYITRMKDQLQRIDYTALVAGNIDFFKTPILANSEEKDYIRFRKRFFSTLQFINQSVGNDPGDSILGIEQAFSNLEYILQSSSLDEIKEFKNQPAVCVAAGPSLDKNIDVLKEYQDQVLIIAADTILERLLSEGINPDIVGVLERTETVYDYFFKELIKENKLPEDVVLVAEGIINPKIYNNFPGKKVSVFRNNIPSEQWLAETTGEITSFDTGNSVANLNYSTALALGCSPIVLVGQDLAFSKEGKGHATGTKYDEVGEKKDEIVTVEGYNGEELKARKWWKIFKEWFEYRIAETEVKCIDATEGGAYIEGTELMSLQEVVEEYCQENLADINQISNSVSTNKIENRVDSLEKGISEELNRLKEIKEMIEEIVDLLETVEKKIDTANNTVGWAQKKFNEINTQIAQMSNGDAIFFFVCQAIFIQLERNKVQLGDLSIDTKNKFKDWCRYDLDKLDDIKQICDILIDVFSEGKESIEQIKLARSDS
ncbi:motility associated factor glycosyltransferase family protein [Halanaerocella petrolearia]